MASTSLMSTPIPVNPLSLPKGVKLQCELCGKQARFKCGSCQVTHYCTQQHLETDFIGIHERICKLLRRLRKSPGFLGSEDERRARAAEEHALKQELLATARRTGHKLLFEGKNELAMPAALHSLRFAIDLFGANNIEVVPSYLLLGEGSIRLSRFKEAEEYLSLAKWSLLKCEDAPFQVRAELARNFGLLYAAQGKHDDALRHLANDVFYSASVYGPEHINTTTGYFLLGTVFYALGREPELSAMFSKVLEVWTAYLRSAVNDLSLLERESFDEAKEAEALKMLQQIAAVREDIHGANHPLHAQALFALAMLHEALRAAETSKAIATRALEIYQSQPVVDAAAVDDVEQLLALIEDDLGQL
eukprot:c13042_g1_i1.p1 GENE.c13042_g1_i1~~c13042_g1_i1.p1  ORF type:complete len:362 (+),score=82.25 c13042_g1_i1:123-1208(+)